MAIVLVWRQWRAQRWPATDGIVEGHRVKSTFGADSPDYQGRPVYRFEVEGSPYRADRLRFGTTSGVVSSDHALDQIQREYPVGSAVTVRYNPKDPAQAVLDPSFDFLPAVLFLVVAGVSGTAGRIFSCG